MIRAQDCEEEQEQINVSRHSLTAKSNLKGDWWNFFLLILLYTIQGLPLGLVIALPIILQSQKRITYGDQVNS